MSSAFWYQKLAYRKASRERIRVWRHDWVRAAFKKTSLQPSNWTALNDYELQQVIISRKRPSSQTSWLKDAMHEIYILDAWQ
jgi:hypothetical protein